MTEVNAFPSASLVVYHSLNIEISTADGSVDGSFSDAIDSVSDGTFDTFDYFENGMRVIRLID